MYKFASFRVVCNRAVPYGFQSRMKGWIESGSGGSDRNRIVAIVVCFRENLFGWNVVLWRICIGLVWHWCPVPIALKWLGTRSQRNVLMGRCTIRIGCRSVGIVCSWSVLASRVSCRMKYYKNAACDRFGVRIMMVASKCSFFLSLVRFSLLNIPCTHHSTDNDENHKINPRQRETKTETERKKQMKFVRIDVGFAHTRSLVRRLIFSVLSLLRLSVYLITHFFSCKIHFYSVSDLGRSGG